MTMTILTNLFPHLKTFPYVKQFESEMFENIEGPTWRLVYTIILSTNLRLRQSNDYIFEAYKYTYKYINSHNTCPQIRVCNKENIFLISQQKHMLWVLKRTTSMRRFF